MIYIKIYYKFESCICVHRWLGSSLESPYEDPMGVSKIGVYADILRPYLWPCDAKVKL